MRGEFVGGVKNGAYLLKNFGPKSQFGYVVHGVLDEVELAALVASNAPLTNYALTHVLPRIAEQAADQGYLTEAMMAAIAQSAPEAKSQVRAFLEGRAAKVRKA